MSLPKDGVLTPKTLMKKREDAPRILVAKAPAAKVAAGKPKTKKT